MATESTVTKLRALLDSIGSMEIPADRRNEILIQLAACWDEFSGSTDTAMSAQKLPRAEDLEWTPPRLTFAIERHGGTVAGSSRADIQSWRVDFETYAASFAITGRRQLRPAAQRLDLRPIVSRVCAAVTVGITTKPPDGVRWHGNDRVEIRPASFIPGNGPQQTITGRRKRFKATLAVAMSTMGWEMVDTRTAWITFTKTAA